MEFHGNFTMDFHGKYLHGGLGHFPWKRLPWNSMEDKETSFHGNFSIDIFHKGFGHFPWNSIEKFNAIP